MRKAVLAFIICSALADIAVCTYWLFYDWREMDRAYWELRHQYKAGAGMRTLFYHDAIQNMHRINCFAEGVGFLLGAILASIGLVAWYHPPSAVGERNAERL
jgi:hypothetical protein